MKTPFVEAYRLDGAAQIRSHGYAWRDGDTCRAYLRGRVAGRLREGDGAEFLRNYIARMPDTGFSLKHLRAEAIQSKPPRDWEVGEAFAEAVLEDHFDCLFPWPTARDQREKEGHATGPDLPGYHLPDKGPERFTFGEVKSSEQKKSPPTVVSGIDAKAGNATLVGQLRRLLTEPTRRQNLIAWLGFREARDTTGTLRFDSALRRYRKTGDCLVVGCLVSGIRPESEVDLVAAQAMLHGIVSEGELWLLAFYLPFDKAEWPSLVAAKEGAT